MNKDYGLKTIEDGFFANFKEETDSIFDGWAIYLLQHFTVSYFLNYCRVFFESPPYEDVVDGANLKRLKRFFEDFEQAFSRDAYLALYDEEYDDNLNLILKPKAEGEFNFMYACMLADYLERAGFIDGLRITHDSDTYLYQGRELVKVREFVNDKGEKTFQYHRLSKDELAQFLDNPELASLELWRQLEPGELIVRYLGTPEDRYFQHLLTLAHLPSDDIMTLFYAIAPNKKSQLAAYVFTHDYPALTPDELNHMSTSLPNAVKKKAINLALKTDNDLYFRALIATYPDLLNDTTLIFKAAKAGASTIIGSLYELGVDLDAKNDIGRTAAHIAALNGYVKVIAKLADLDKDLLNTKDKDGRTTAHYAAYDGHAEVIAKLNDLNVDLSAKDNFGYTPAHLAARKGHIEVIAQLGELNVDLSAKDNSGYTPAHYAAGEGHAEVIAKLAELGVDLTAKDNSGHTPAHYAADQGHAEVIAKLAELGVDLTAKNNSGDTPAHYAAYHGHAEVIAKLAELGVDLNAKDNLGQTAAHIAAILGHAKVIADLKKLKVDFNIKDNSGKTAADIIALKKPTNLLTTVVLPALALGSIGLCLGALAAAIALIAMTHAVLVPVVACTAVMTVGVIGLASAGFFAGRIKQSEKATQPPAYGALCAVSN